MQSLAESLNTATNRFKLVDYLIDAHDRFGSAAAEAGPAEAVEETLAFVRFALNRMGPAAKESCGGGKRAELMEESTHGYPPDVVIHLQRVLAVLRDDGILLESDRSLPSIVTLVAGEPVQGSWWGHPKGGLIYAVTQALIDQPDVLLTKLVSGKLTYIHRDRWAPLVSIATARQGWQMGNLIGPAGSLLTLIAQHGEIVTNDFFLKDQFPGGRLGGLVRQLERRLLVHTREVHTQSGGHAKILSTWEHWAETAGLLATKGDLDIAKQGFERVVAQLNAACGGNGRLPWQPRAS